jgi:hypothetical protein
MLINNLDRMSGEKTPKQVLKYKPTGHRDQGRPWKMWVDEVGTGFNLNLEVKKNYKLK